MTVRQRLADLLRTIAWWLAPPESLHPPVTVRPSRVGSVRSRVTNPKAGMWDPDRKGTVSVVLGRDYPSSGRPATSLAPPPARSAPGARTG